MSAESLLIEGGSRLSGHVEIEGAKNAALPACVASLLTDETIVLHRVPQLRDVSTILFTLTDLGRRIVRRRKLSRERAHQWVKSDSVFSEHLNQRDIVKVLDGAGQGRPEEALVLSG